jgi:hypothetical protein
VASAAVAIAIRKVVSHLMSNNAVSAESAVHFAPERLLQRRLLARLVRRGVVVETAPDLYYLDIPTYDRWRRSLRRRIAALVGGVAVASVVAAILAS